MLRTIRIVLRGWGISIVLFGRGVLEGSLSVGGF